MGKSKNGGTRSFLRGRVGSDVYSIGKDGKGQKQQVVRSLAETVANPQTAAQMRGRMYMSTVMQAVSAMAAIIDHSFDNVAVGQPNISEFVSRNYKLIKADAIAHPSASNVFGLVKYGVKGIKKGAYVISDGNAAALSGVTLDGTAKTLTIALSADAKVSDLKAALGISTADYFTVCAIDATAGFVFDRISIDGSIAEDTVIGSGNVASLFTQEGNISAVASMSTNNVVLTFSALSENNGIIVSRKTNDGWKHSKCQLAAPSSPEFTSDVALPTYPIGEQRFLNGGDDSTGAVPSTNEPSNGGGGGSNGGGGNNGGGGDDDENT